MKLIFWWHHKIMQNIGSRFPQGIGSFMFFEPRKGHVHDHICTILADFHYFCNTIITRRFRKTSRIDSKTDKRKSENRQTEKQKQTNRKAKTAKRKGENRQNGKAKTDKTERQKEENHTQ